MPTKKAVVIFTDAFGLNIPNAKLIADELASQLHCDVWVPDYFLGELLTRQERKFYLSDFTIRDATHPCRFNGFIRPCRCQGIIVAVDKARLYSLNTEYWIILEKQTFPS
jgi:hypothetical protein